MLITHAGRFVLGVDELVVADIDADVRETPGVGVLEEDQIARLQIALRDAGAGRDLGEEPGADVTPEDVQTTQ